MRYAVSSSGACRSTRSSHDCFVSSIAAQSSPRGSSPAPSSAPPGGTRWASLPMPSSPSAVASRRGIDREHERLAAEAGRRAERGRRRDRRLADAARAAADDDLPSWRRAARAWSMSELRAERVGDHARGAGRDRARTGTARRATGGRPSRAARRDGPRACGATTPRVGPRRAPRPSPGPACPTSTSIASGSRSASNVSSSLCVNSSGSTRLTITAPSGTSTSAQRATSSIVSVTGISSGVVTMFTAVTCGIGEQLGDPARLVAQRTDVDELLDRVGRAELGDDVAGRGRVDHDDVVLGAPLDRLAHLPHDLADREDLLHARRRRPATKSSTRERTEPADHRHPHVEAQVLAQRRFGVHRHREHAGIDLARREPDRLLLELRGHVALGVDLDEQDALARARREQRGGRGHRALADAALAREEQAAPIEEVGPGSRRTHHDVATASRSQPCDRRRRPRSRRRRACRAGCPAGGPWSR